MGKGERRRERDRKNEQGIDKKLKKIRLPLKKKSFGFVLSIFSRNP